MIPKRKPVTPGYIFKTEFLEELGLSQQAAAELMGVSRKTVNELVMSPVFNQRQLEPMNVCAVNRPSRSSCELKSSLKQAMICIKAGQVCIVVTPNFL